jgi:hypothetical protein
VGQVKKLIEMGVSDLATFAVLPAVRIGLGIEPDYDFDEEHLALHSVVVCNSAGREKSLAEYLARECPILNRRIEDGVVDAPSARAALAWTLRQMKTDGLTRYQLGLLADGAVRAIRGRRDLLKNAKVDLMANNALSVLATYSAWTTCDGDDSCDRCQSGHRSRCRFVRTPRKLVWTAMYSKDDHVPLAVAERFLFGVSVRPLGNASWYDRFQLLEPDAALRGAMVAARTMRSLGHGDHALGAIKALWAKGLRTPELTTIYSALEEDNLAELSLTTALRRALRICDAGIDAGASGDWDTVTTRQKRLSRRIEKVEQPPFVEPYNQRPAHPLRFVRP